MSFTEPLPTDEGWAKQNRHYWQRDYPGFLEFFFGEAFSEPHSTKQIEDGSAGRWRRRPDTLSRHLAARFTPQSDGAGVYRTIKSPGAGAPWRRGPLIPPMRGRRGGRRDRRRLLRWKGRATARSHATP